MRPFIKREIKEEEGPHLNAGVRSPTPHGAAQGIKREGSVKRERSLEPGDGDGDVGMNVAQGAASPVNGRRRERERAPSAVVQSEDAWTEIRRVEADGQKRKKARKEAVVAQELSRAAAGAELLIAPTDAQLLVSARLRRMGFTSCADFKKLGLFRSSRHALAQDLEAGNIPADVAKGLARMAMPSP